MAPQQPAEADPRPIPHWLSADADVIDVTEGDGAYVTAADGERYLDFISQLYCVNAGHGNQAIVDAMVEQLGRIQYVSSAKHNDTRSRLADRLVDVAPAGLSDVYFAISGSEAVETAVQLARQHQDAPKVLTRWRSYHGGTYGAASLSGDPQMRATMESHVATTGATKFLPPMGYRSPFNADSPEQLTELAADHLEFVIRNEDPDSIAAIVMEPVAGTSGAYPAPPGYFERVRELCDEHDILLIADEVITGFGRCGDWFGIEGEGVRPDMITFAKAVTSAYAPLAGVLTSEELSDWIREEGTDLGQTFAGHPVACAAGIAALDEYGGDDGLIEQGRAVAPYLEDRLGTLADAHDAVGDVRGRGHLWAVEFTDPETGEPYVDPWVSDEPNPVGDVVEAAQDDGVLLATGRPGFQIIVAPPLVIDEADVDRAVEALDGAIEAVFG
ncbi:MAG: aspartate aminotransferase family protein [Halobacteriales archaeon]|nr:aspartate aminotransferase family protein [Halobacteriales archaeon]